MKVEIDLSLAIDIVEKLAEIRSFIGEDIITLNNLSDRLKQQICADENAGIAAKPMDNKPHLLSMRIGLNSGIMINYNDRECQKRITYTIDKDSGTMDLLVNIGPLE